MLSVSFSVRLQRSTLSGQKGKAIPMPAEIDGTKAVYAKTPAWHRIGTVMEDTFSAAQALAILNPTDEQVRKAKITGTFYDKDGVEHTLDFSEHAGLVDFDHENGAWRPLSVMGKDIGVVQLEDQFAFMDQVIGKVDGAHYEAGVRLRKGKQTCLTAFLGDFVLDPNGIADRNKKFLWGFNSYDGSWALRLKFGNFRVECANMAAMALRGSSDTNVVNSDWSTRHTANIGNRVDEAARALGFWKDYEILYEAQAEHMIHVPLDDNLFERVIRDLFTTVNVETQEKETDTEACVTVRTIYELSASQADLHGTMWGGLNAVIEHHDWVTNVRGGKNATVQERRFLRQVEDPSGLKQQAWDRFWFAAEEAKKFKMPAMA